MKLKTSNNRFADTNKKTRLTKNCVGWNNFGDHNSGG